MSESKTSFDVTDIKKAILKSQRCFRNWDLTKSIPAEHLDILKYSVTQSPSLQNVAFYKVHWLEDRDIIEKVHACTHGAPYKKVGDKKLVDPNPRADDAMYEMGDTTQPQTLANIVVVFEKYYKEEEDFKERRVFNTAMGEGARKVGNAGNDFDTQVALGIASGYLNITASLLGYETGCCISMKHDKVKEVLNMEGEPLLIMGIGIKDPELNRRVHHEDHEIVFPTNPRQEVPLVEYR